MHIEWLPYRPCLHRHHASSSSPQAEHLQTSGQLYEIALALHNRNIYSNPGEQLSRPFPPSFEAFLFSSSPLFSTHATAAYAFCGVSAPPPTHHLASSHPLPPAPKPAFSEATTTPATTYSNSKQYIHVDIYKNWSTNITSWFRYIKSERKKRGRSEGDGVTR